MSQILSRTNHIWVLSVLFLLVGSMNSYYWQVPALETTQVQHNFLADVGACSCNVTASCDTFCCCDSACSKSNVDTWRNNKWCANTHREMEKFCNQVGEEAHGAFEDIGCVMYSNRGAIGEFYSIPAQQRVQETLKFSSRYQSSWTNSLQGTTNTPLVVSPTPSAKPGYINGIPVTISEESSSNSVQIHSIAQPDGSCYPSNVSNAPSLKVSFGVNSVLTCLVGTSTTTYLDQLFQKSVNGSVNLTVPKYAKHSNETVRIIGGNNGNINASYTLTLIYSQVGWVLDPQNYIVGGHVTVEQNNNAIVQKQLRVRWVKVSPDEIESPPTNNFYKYFSKLWLPLKNNLNSFVNWEQYIMAAALPILVSLM